MLRPSRFHIQRGPAGIDSIEPDFDYEAPLTDLEDPLPESAPFIPFAPSSEPLTESEL